MRFVLAHISDVHLGPLPRPSPRELMGKRLTGYLNWRTGRHRTHDMMVLGRLVADMKAHRPQHIAMTGDILNIGLPAEFAAGRAWLETLGAPHDVSFVPGNHDAYTRGAMPHLSRTFAPWVCDSVPSEPTFPYLRVRDGIALIGLSSGVPTAPLLASGKLGRNQARAFANLLDRTRDFVRVVMIHHPPHNGRTAFARGLMDARRFEAAIRLHGADLVLHGHNHRSSVTYVRGPKGPVPIVGVASGSAVPGTLNHRAAYHLFTIGRAADGSARIEGRARGLLTASGEIGDLGALPLASTPA